MGGVNAEEWEWRLRCSVCDKSKIGACKLINHIKSRCAIKGVLSGPCVKFR